MSADYIPSREADMDTWVLNFKTLIAANPTSYGLSASDATAIGTAYTNWHAAYLAAIGPTTRNVSTIGTKNEQKAVVLGVVRGYAATIRANRAVSSALKSGLGLHVPTGTTTPVPPPATSPVLAFHGMRPGVQSVQATDETTPTHRGKPAGVAGLLLFRTVAAEPAVDAEAAHFLGFVTRADYTATYTTADTGKVATYFARWTNAKGEMGPWSSPLSMPIAA